MSPGAWLELIASGLIAGGVYALVALGLNLQYGLMRILDIAHGEFLMLGAFVTWAAHSSLGISPLFMVPVSFFLLMGVGVTLHRLIFRRLTRTSANLDVFEARGLMACFGLMFLVQNFAQLIWGGDLRGYDFLAEPVAIGGAQFAANKLLLIAMALVFSTALIVVLRATLLGKGVRALLQSPTGAQLVGIDTRRIYMTTFAIGTACAGAAGVLVAPLVTIEPTTGELFNIIAFVVVVLGGMGNVIGALVGGLLIGLTEQLGALLLPGQSPLLSIFIVFVLVLLFRPQGLFGKTS